MPAPITAQTREQILDRIGALPGGTKFFVLAPLIRGQKGEYRDLFDDLQKQGFVRARVDGRMVRLGDDLHLDRQMRHNIEVVVDRLVSGPKIRPRLAEAVELALHLGGGNIVVAMEGEEGVQGSGLRVEGSGFRVQDSEGSPGSRTWAALPQEVDQERQKKAKTSRDFVPPVQNRCYPIPLILHPSSLIPPTSPFPPITPARIAT